MLRMKHITFKYSFSILIILDTYINQFSLCLYFKLDGFKFQQIAFIRFCGNKYNYIIRNICMERHFSLPLWSVPYRTLLVFHYVLSAPETFRYDAGPTIKRVSLYIKYMWKTAKIGVHQVSLTK